MTGARCKMSDFQEALRLWFKAGQVRSRTREQAGQYITQTVRSDWIKWGQRNPGLMQGITNAYSALVKSKGQDAANGWLAHQVVKRTGHKLSDIRAVMAQLTESRAREQGPNMLRRDTLFRVMAMLRDAKGMLGGLLPEGTEGAVRQAQKSIESAHWKLNSVSSKFQEAVQEQRAHWTPADARTLSRGKFKQQGNKWVRVIGQYMLEIWMNAPGVWIAQATGPGRKVSAPAASARDAVSKSSLVLEQVT